MFGERKRSGTGKKEGKKRKKKGRNDVLMRLGRRLPPGAEEDVRPCLGTDGGHMCAIKWSKMQQDHQSLLKAKYCTRVAAVSCTQKHQKYTCDLDLWPTTLKFSRFVDVVKVQYMFVQNCVSPSAAVHEIWCQQRNRNLATMVKTILPSLPQTVMNYLLYCSPCEPVQQNTTKYNFPASW